MFLLMLAAVVLPDYLQYRLRIKQLELLQRQISALSTPSPTPQSSPGVGETGPVQSPSIATPPSDSASLFESYARFLTLLVGLVSVLGFFLGFFIRRSIRETEEDMDKRLTKSVEGWRDERKEIRQSYTEQSEKLEKKLKEVEALEENLGTLEVRLRTALESLEASQKQYERGTPEAIPDAAEVARTLDSELERSESQAELTEQETTAKAEKPNDQ